MLRSTEMFAAFWVIVGLVGILLLRNAFYGLRRYGGDRNRMLLGFYFMFLVILGYLLINTTFRVMSLVQVATEGTDSGLSSAG